MNKKIKEFVSDTDQSTVLSTKNYNENRTIIFETNKKVHQSDSIAWVVGSVTFLLFLILSAGRFLTIGAFFDDIFFNFVFGWLKYLVYLVLMFIDLSILFGLQLKVKKRFLGMLIAIGLTVVWICSVTLLIDLKVKHLDGVKLWQKDIFVKSVTIYTSNWLDNSLFSNKFNDVSGHTKFLIYPLFGYLNLYQGGGFLGNFLAGVFAYASLPVGLILGIIALFLSIIWTLTGNPLFLFLPKAKRKGKRVRVLALRSNNNPHDQKKPLFNLTKHKNSSTKVLFWQEPSEAPFPDETPPSAQEPSSAIKKDFSEIDWNEPEDEYETFTMFDENQDIDLKYHQVKPTTTLIDTEIKVDPQLGVYGFKPLREPTIKTFTTNNDQEVDDSLFFKEILKSSQDRSDTQADVLMDNPSAFLSHSVNLDQDFPLNYQTQKDWLYKQALAEVLKARKASATLLKRWLKISLSQASEIIDRMEQEGVIGPANGTKTREVYYKS